jgi:hypothetical protein
MVLGDQMPIPSAQIFSLALMILPNANDCPTSSIPEPYRWNFVTCLWNAQECSYSCPTPQIVKVVEDPQICLDEFLKLACYCGEKI